MKLALVQMDIEWESKKLNHEKAGNLIKKAAIEGCDVVVFPEMFTSGFSMNIAAITEGEGGETDALLSKMAGEHTINIIAGYALKNPDGNKGKNIAAVYDRKGNLLSRYTKIYPFSYAEENLYFSAGSETVTFMIDGVHSSVFICYDLRFPEVFRTIAHAVQVVFIIANWPAVRVDHWKTLLKARAIENQLFVIGVNRTGIDGNNISYPGASCIFDPAGKEICSGSERDIFLTTEINVDEVLHMRREYPFLKDMRPIKIDFDKTEER